MMPDGFEADEEAVEENKKAKLAVQKADAEQVSFEKINDSIVIDRLRKTNIDELSDDELRSFIKELTTYL
jgi:DNA mismatch repair protein MutS